MDQAIRTPKLQHCLSKLLGYEYTTIFRQGKDNLVADALARHAETSAAHIFGFSTLKFLFLDQLIQENKSNPELIFLHKLILADPLTYAKFKSKMIYYSRMRN